MDGKKVDRRVQRTRHLLQEAIVALIQEKGYEAVTVQDILDRANLGRSTFYAHFRDKEDLLLSGFENVRRLFEEHQAAMQESQGEAAGDFWEMSLVWFSHAQDYRAMYRAMVGGQGGEVVGKYIHKYLAGLMRDHAGQISAGGGGGSELPELVVDWTVSSLLTLTGWWLDHDLPYSAEEMNRIFRNLTQPGVEAVLSQPAVLKRNTQAKRREYMR